MSYWTTSMVHSTDMDMELTKKTTILFPPELHDRLTRLAASQGKSLAIWCVMRVRANMGSRPPRNASRRRDASPHSSFRL
jgi:hypothetical protein